MKISLQCENLLLQSTLEYFLRQYLSPQESCDFILSDTKRHSDKPVCVLGSEDCDLRQPFTPQALLMALQDFYATHLDSVRAPTQLPTDLESEIATLLREYTHKLYELFKKHA